ncbi:MAG: hypothetical protein ACOC0A_05565 [Planctomycetota bacterium]
MENLVFIIIFGLFLLVNALVKKAAASRDEKTSTQTEGSAPNQNSDEYRPSPDDLQEFLRKASGKEQSPSKKQSQRRRATETRSGQTSAHAASQEKTKKKRQEAERIRRKHKEEQQEVTRSSDQSATQSTQSKPAQKQGYTAPALPGRPKGRQRSRFDLDTDHLANAVIWSEILRPPVSLRSEEGEDQGQIMSR